MPCKIGLRHGRATRCMVIKIRGFTRLGIINKTIWLSDSRYISADFADDGIIFQYILIHLIVLFVSIFNYLYLIYCFNSCIANIVKKKYMRSLLMNSQEARVKLLTQLLFGLLQEGRKESWRSTKWRDEGLSLIWWNHPSAQNMPQSSMPESIQLEYMDKGSPNGVVPPGRL
jgi:hypothetical protein